ncbi:MAG: glycosyltransferase family 2 protein [Desulfatitalea sp.]|nr:glycosyltransferase family 2 protein [Desulfatitalea sp.]NNJ99174.1 glycosyltransferase family 2 protein [Desulfatitalea sp.]
MIDIIIPNWNGKKLLEICLASLAKQDCKDFTITVVDNGSSDDSLGFLENCYPEIQVISFSENRGFSVAVNEGIKATENPWVFLLNNDIEVENDCITQLKKACINNRKYDFFALKMIDYYHRDKIDGAGDAVLRAGVGYRIGTMELDCRRYAIQRDVFGACAGAALYKRSMFDKIGCFDEDFFAYLEDVDFSIRAVRAGNRCCYLPDVRVYHMGSASSGSRINAFIVSHSTRNNIFIILKNYYLELFLRFLPSIIVYQVLWFLFVVKYRHVLAYAKGFFQGLKCFRKMIRRGIHDRKMNGRIPESVFGNMIIESEKQALFSIMRRRKQLGKSNLLFDAYLRIFIGKN